MTRWQSWQGSTIFIRRKRPQCNTSLIFPRLTNYRQRTYKKKLDERGIRKNLTLPVAQFIIEKQSQRSEMPTDFILYDTPITVNKAEETVRRSKGGALVRGKIMYVL
jgi:hypothetical protein